MAYIGNVINKNMSLRVVTGTDDDGADVLKTYTYSSIKTTATNDQIGSTAAALSPLFGGEVQQVRASETVALTVE